MIILLFALTGWLGGIIVNYFSDLLPHERRLTNPICILCFQSQPIINYLFWPRRCDKCQKRRPWRVWVVEVVFILTSIWLGKSPQADLGYLVSLMLLIYFGVVVVIDLEHRLILHPVSLIGSFFGLSLGWYLHGLWISLIGGAVGFGTMLGLYYFGDLFARWLARRRGETLTEVALGFGDVNLSGVIGLLLGWPGIVGGLILTILLGGLVSLVYMLGLIIIRRYRFFTAIPYGPFLIASAIILIFFGEQFLSLFP